MPQPISCALEWHSYSPRLTERRGRSAKLVEAVTIGEMAAGAAEEVDVEEAEAEEEVEAEDEVAVAEDMYVPHQT